MTRIGLVARATTSGLGYLSREFDNNMRPVERLVITDCDNRYKDNIEWYDGSATFVRFGDMNLFPYERFLGEIDLLFSYETFYHPKLLDTAKRMGVRTVLMGMPELTRRSGHSGWSGDPDEYVWPTNWHRPVEERHLAVPTGGIGPRVDTMRREGPLRVLHVAGARAIGDRNGTELFIGSLRHVKEPLYVRIAVHDRFLPDLSRVPKHINVEVMRDATSRWTMYADMNLLVMPRRYGGLCLPVQEATERGLAILMPDCSPNREYPAHLLPSRKGPYQRVPIGRVETAFTDPREIAHAIDTMARNDDLLSYAQSMAYEWAEANSWDNLLPYYHEVLTAR